MLVILSVYFYSFTRTSVTLDQGLHWCSHFDILLLQWPYVQIRAYSGILRNPLCLFEAHSSNYNHTLLLGVLLWRMCPCSPLLHVKKDCYVGLELVRNSCCGLIKDLLDDRLAQVESGLPTERWPFVYGDFSLLYNNNIFLDWECS